MNGGQRRTKSRFTRFFMKENGLDREFKEWAFRRGMLFGATDKWWGDRGRRAAPHEGVDFCLYSTASGVVIPIGEAARVPVMYNGVVARIIDDFLGRTIIVSHTCSAGESGSFSLYGHTVPWAGIEIGRTVRAGTIIATVADTGRSRSGVEAHLHVSVGHSTGQVPLDEMDWTNMGEALTMSDPLDVIEGPFLIEEDGD